MYNMVFTMGEIKLDFDGDNVGRKKSKVLVVSVVFSIRHIGPGIITEYSPRVPNWS